MFWVYGGGFIMGDASEENYLPGPLLDTREVPQTDLNFQNKKLTPNSISCTFLYFFISMLEQSTITEENCTFGSMWNSGIISI